MGCRGGILFIGLMLFIFQTPTCTAKIKYFEYIIQVIATTLSGEKKHYKHYESIIEMDGNKVAPDLKVVKEHITDHFNKTQTDVTFVLEKDPDTHKIKDIIAHEISEELFKLKQHHTKFSCLLDTENGHSRRCLLKMAEHKKASP